MRPITILSLMTICSCSVAYPPGWAARREPPMVIEPAPFRGVFVGPPRSWGLPDGRVVQLDVDANAVGMFATIFRADIEFSAAFRNEPRARIHCQTDPETDGFPETRFGCWGEQLRFWFTPGEECVTSLQSQMESDCWNGDLTVGGRSVSLVRGQMERSGLPVSQFSWVAGEDPLFVVDIRVEREIRIYDAGAGMSDDLRNRLLVLTVALAYFERASDLD